MNINYFNMNNMAFFNTNDIGIEYLRDKIGNSAATSIQQHIRNRSSLKHLKRQFIIILMTLTESQYNYVKEQIEKTQQYNRTYYQKRMLEKIFIASEKPKGRKPNQPPTMEQALKKYEQIHMKLSN